MLEILAILCLIGAIALLVVLSYIDLEQGILPNELVLGLAVCGFVFHITTLFEFGSVPDAALGAFIGGGILYVIRGFSNYYYQDDTLGLGDVKLLAAGGLWLGPDHVLIAMAVGAMAGFVHGLGVAVYIVRNAKVPLELSKLSIPAGPGFAVGIVIAAIYKFWEFPAMIIEFLS